MAERRPASTAPSPPSEEILHASAVSLDGRACLILGASGSGKSTLALALIARGAKLIADDRVLVRPRLDAAPLLTCPPGLPAAIECRGLGLIAQPLAKAAPVHLIVDLDLTPTARLPDPAHRTLGGAEIRSIAGQGVACLANAVPQFLRHGFHTPESDPPHA